MNSRSRSSTIHTSRILLVPFIVHCSTSRILLFIVPATGTGRHAHGQRSPAGLEPQAQGKGKGKGKQQPKPKAAEKQAAAADSKPKESSDKGAEKNLVNDMAAARIQANARGRRVRRERQAGRA